VTDEGVGKQNLTVNTPHPALRATFPPRGEGFYSGKVSKIDFCGTKCTNTCILCCKCDIL